MLSGANAFEISNIQEDETEAIRTRRAECNNVTLPLNGSMELLRTTGIESSVEPTHGRADTLGFGGSLNP